MEGGKSVHEVRFEVAVEVIQSLPTDGNEVNITSVDVHFAHDSKEGGYIIRFYGAMSTF